MKTYVFQIQVEVDEGRWVAEVPSLPGCVTEGDSKEEALAALKEATQDYLEVMHEHGDELPLDAQKEVIVIADSEVVAVTV